MKDFMRIQNMCVLIAMSCYLGFVGSVEAVPDKINVQGVLANNNGDPLTGNRAYQLRFYDSEIGGASLGTAVGGVVEVSQAGRFSIDLIPPITIFGSVEVYYELGIDSSEPMDQSVDPNDFFSGRVQLHSVPFALRARDTEQLGGLPASTYVQSGSVSNDAWSLTGNSSVGSSFLGTNGNETLEMRVNNMTALRLIPNASPPSIVGGAAINSVTNGAMGAVISGGGGTAALKSAKGAFIISGPNRISGDFGTISGGVDNTVSDVVGTVGGGISNTAGDTAATIGGGESNTASGNHATIAGGDDNRALANRSTIGGGQDNLAQNTGSTVSGGQSNEAIEEFTTIGGGQSNTSSGLSSTVSGGFGNAASGASSAIGGGSLNAAPGFGGTVPGGLANAATGEFSFAAGLQAKALHNGSFVWADSQGIDFPSTATDQFLVRAQGGMGIGWATPTEQLDVGGAARFRKSDQAHLLISGQSDDLDLEQVTSDDPDAVARIRMNRTVDVGDEDEPYGNMQFFTRNKGSSTATERMRILRNGRVGIGTDSPASLFDVDGTATIQSLDVTSGADVEGTLTAESVTVSHPSADTTLRVDSNDGGLDEDAVVLFQVSDNSPATTFVMGIDDSDGNKFKIGKSSISGTNFFTVDGNDSIAMGGNPELNFKLKVYGAATKTAGGDTWNTTSDRRVKTDIHGIENAVETINKLRPVEYRYNEDYLKEHPEIEDRYYHYFIAQEYAEVFPKGVVMGKDGLLSMNSTSANVYTIKAVQELSDENQKLRAELEEIRQEINSLKDAMTN